MATLIYHTSVVVKRSIYLCNWQWQVNHKYPQNALLHFCYTICYPNSPQCYVICSLPVLLPYRIFRLASSGKWQGEVSREHCLGHDRSETFVQNSFFGRSVVSAIVDEAHYTRYPKRKHRFPRLMHNGQLLLNLVWSGLSTWRLRRAVRRIVSRRCRVPKLPPNAGMSSVCCTDFGRMDCVVIF